MQYEQSTEQTTCAAQLVLRLSLLTQKQVCFMLRRLAANKRPDEKELMMVANNVEDFAFCLLDALETDSDYISKYEGFLAEVLDAAIGFHQKKVFLRPL